MKLLFQALRQAIATASFPDSEIQNDVTGLLHDMSKSLSDLDLEELGIPEDDEEKMNDRAKSLLHTIHSALIGEQIESAPEDVSHDLPDEDDRIIIGKNDD